MHFPDLTKARLRFTSALCSNFTAASAIAAVSSWKAPFSLIWYAGLVILFSIVGFWLEELVDDSDFSSF